MVHLINVRTLVLTAFHLIKFWVVLEFHDFCDFATCTETNRKEKQTWKLMAEAKWNARKAKQTKRIRVVVEGHTSTGCVVIEN